MSDVHSQVRNAFNNSFGEVKDKAIDVKAKKAGDDNEGATKIPTTQSTPVMPSERVLVDSVLQALHLYRSDLSTVCLVGVPLFMINAALLIVQDRIPRFGSYYSGAVVIVGLVLVLAARQRKDLRLDAIAFVWLTLGGIMPLITNFVFQLPTFVAGFFNVQ